MAQVTSTQTQGAARPLGLPAILTRLLRNDARLIGRDSFLSMLAGYIVFVALLLRFGLPALAENLAANPEVPFSLVDYYPLLVAYMVVFLGSVVAGMIIGFIVLDERDDNTIKALLVTPVPVNFYIAYRVAVPMVIAFFITILEITIINLALIEFWQLLIIAAAASLTAPLVMLFFSTFAENKVQGFAMNKIVGILGLLIMAAWFVQPPLQYAIGIFPPYWFAKAYWLAYAGDPNWGWAVVLGILTSSALLAFFVRRFRTIVYR